MTLALQPGLLAACGERHMPKGAGYRQYAEKCIKLAQTATPVHRAHLLRVAKTWLDVAERMEQSPEFLATTDEAYSREKEGSRSSMAPALVG